jgi:hypothetical protein
MTTGLVAAGGLFAAAHGQSVVRGSVRVDSVGRPIVGAQVSVEGTPAHSAETNGAGEFALGGLAGGQHTLSIRAIGYRPLQLQAVLSGGDTLELDVRLVGLAQELTPIAVVGERPRRLSAKMEEFERRRRMGLGSFLTREDLAKVETSPMSNVLRFASGIRLILLPTPCGGGIAAASGRRTTVPILGVMKCQEVAEGTDLEIPIACYMDIYVDGVSYWRFGQGPPVRIDDFVARDYQAIEVYRGRSELPIELTRGEPDCGAIVFWTRTGEP